MDPENQEYSTENQDDSATSWPAPNYASTDEHHVGSPASTDSLMSFDPAPAPITHGGLDVGGLTLPASLTDPAAHPASDPDGLPAGIFDPLPPAPHHAPSTVGEKVYDALTNPPAPPAPPEDPSELERQQQQKASENAIGQHTPMTPDIRF